MISQTLLPEFDHEMATTRKYVERFPEEHKGFRPHDTSMDMARLTTHVVEMVGWTVPTLQLDELDLTGYQPVLYDTRAALLETFDKNLAAARAAIEALDDAAWMKPWSLSAGGQKFFTQPRIGVMRGMIMNHIIHHRGQLSVYYRTVGVPIPSTYGPSGDER